MQKRIVVLGGSGFLGTHLCLRLLDEGHELFCVDLREPVRRLPVQKIERTSRSRFVRHNIIHPFSIRCDEIYNLVSPPVLHYNKALPVDTLKICLAGTLNMLDTARCEHARVLYASSSTVYGTELYPTLLQSDPFLPADHALAEGKRAAEALCRAYNAEFGVDCRIARIFNTYGSGADPMDQRVVMKMVAAALQNRPLQVTGSGEQLRTFCWVGDMIEGLVRLMAADPAERTRIVDLGSTHEISIRALAEKIIELTGSHSRIIHTEVRPGELRRKVPDLTVAREELGWTPQVTLVEGLRRTIAYAENLLAEKKHAGMTWAEIN